MPSFLGFSSDIHLDKNVQFIWLFEKSTRILGPVSKLTEKKNNQTVQTSVAIHEHWDFYTNTLFKVSFILIPFLF